jgi:hypothetical protein
MIASHQESPAFPAGMPRDIGSTGLHFRTEIAKPVMNQVTTTPGDGRQSTTYSDTESP